MTSHTPHICVIGAGITGLVSAYELAQKGYKVTLIEASPELGGLAAGFSFEGTYLEKAYHHIFKTDYDIISFTKKLGISNSLVFQPSSIAICLGGKVYPFSTPKDLLTFPLLSFIDKIRVGLTVLYLQKLPLWKQFIAESAHDWMRKWCGNTAYQIIWEPLLRGKFHHFYTHVSMAWLWARVHVRAQSKKGTSGTEELGYFKGGFQVLVHTIQDHLNALNVTIYSNTKVKSIRYEDADQSVKVTDELGNEQSFDKVLCTIPSTVFARMIDGANEVTSDYLSTLRSIDYLSAVCVVFSSDQSLSSYYWHNVNEVDSPFIAMVQHTNFIGKEYYNNKHVYYLGTYMPIDHEIMKMDDIAIKKTFFSYLKKMFPAFEESHIHESHVFKFAHAQHVVTPDYPKIRPEYQTPIPSVLLANFSQIFPEDRGTNFAVREGVKLSEMIHNSFGAVTT